MTDENPRCWRCNKILAAFLTRPWSLQCKGRWNREACKAVNDSSERDVVESV